MYLLVEPVCHVGQHACGLQRRHRHQDSQEEEDRRHVDMLEHLRHAAFDRLLDAALAVVDDLRQNPHHTQRDHHAHVGRQVRDALEYRYEQQAQYARDEDEFAQARAHAHGQFRFERTLVHRGRILVADIPGGDCRRDDDRDDARHEERPHQRCRGDVAPHPQHDRRHVADR